MRIGNKIQNFHSLYKRSTVVVSLGTHASQAVQPNYCFQSNCYFRSMAKLLENYVIKVPVMGEAVKQGDLIEWLKKPGDAVAEDEVVCVLETDKVTVDIHSLVAGTLSAQLAKVGESVLTDQPLAEIAMGEQGALLYSVFFINHLITQTHRYL